jgi:membrane-bound ClpP family serine protease
MDFNFWLKRALLLAVAYVLYLYSWQTAFGAETVNGPTILSLTGHLSREELQSAQQKLNHISFSKPLVIVLNSTSGDLPLSLDLSKKIYELKSEKKLPVVVYIQDNAVGPAAIFPFLADTLYASNFISWGDIPFGNEKVFSPNVLRNRVINVIDPKQPHAALLRLLASAMADPSIQIVDDHGWRLAKNNDSGLPTISLKGETLIVNHNQLNELGMIKDILSSEQFNALYPISSETRSIDTSASFPSAQGAMIPKSTFEAELKKHIIFNPSGPNTIGHIIVEDHSVAITQATWLYIKSALDHYKQTKPAFIILELNTPGGEVFAAQKISDALKEMDTQFNIPIVAYVNNWAISAGAMLAYSSRFIITAKDGSMGAAEPVYAGVEGKMETASEKVNSALRADFANRARFFGRDPLIAEAMVDKDLIIVLRHGKVIKLDNENQIRTEGTDPDTVISPKGKLLTLDAEQMITYGVADLMLPPTKTSPLTTQEVDAGKWPVDKSPIFHQPFFDQIPNATIDSYQMDWKMRFFMFLASPVISSLLMLGLMLGAYLEMSHPGFGLPGTLAVTCLFLIMLSSFSLEIANWLEVILLFTGLAIILIELFVLPTFGVLGFIGIIFFLMGLFGMMLPGADSVGYEFDTKTFNAAGVAFFERLAWLCGTFVVGLILIAVLARFVTPRFAAFSRLVLKGNEQVGFTSVENLSELPKPGSQGEAATMLRPSGKVVINNIQYDAMSRGPFIERGHRITVTGIDSGTLLVAEVENHNDHKEI